MLTTDGSLPGIILWFGGKEKKKAFLFVRMWVG